MVGVVIVFLQCAASIRRGAHVTSVTVDDIR